MLATWIFHVSFFPHTERMSAYTVPTPVFFRVGSFDYFCDKIGLPICSLVGTTLVKEPQCYARNIDLGGGFLLFQPAVIAIHIIALIMTSIMISHTKFKINSFNDC